MNIYLDMYNYAWLSFEALFCIILISYLLILIWYVLNCFRHEARGIPQKGVYPQVGLTSCRSLAAGRQDLPSSPRRDLSHVFQKGGQRGLCPAKTPSLVFHRAVIRAETRQNPQVLTKIQWAFLVDWLTKQDPGSSCNRWTAFFLRQPQKNCKRTVQRRCFSPFNKIRTRALNHHSFFKPWSPKAARSPSGKGPRVVVEHVGLVAPHFLHPKFVWKNMAVRVTWWLMPRFSAVKPVLNDRPIHWCSRLGLLLDLHWVSYHFSPEIDMDHDNEWMEIN